MQKESTKIYEGERVDIKKQGKTTRSDTLRLQGSSEGNWANLKEHVGRTAGTPCQSTFKVKLGAL